jgi:hypothetical protein
LVVPAAFVPVKVDEVTSRSKKKKRESQKIFLRVDAGTSTFHTTTVHAKAMSGYNSRAATPEGRRASTGAEATALAAAASSASLPTGSIAPSPHPPSYEPSVVHVESLEEQLKAMEVKQQQDQQKHDQQLRGERQRRQEEEERSRVEQQRADGLRLQILADRREREKERLLTDDLKSSLEDSMTHLERERNEARNETRRVVHQAVAAREEAEEGGRRTAEHVAQLEAEVAAMRQSGSDAAAHEESIRRRIAAAAVRGSAGDADFTAATEALARVISARSSPSFRSCVSPETQASASPAPRMTIGGVSSIHAVGPEASVPAAASTIDPAIAAMAAQMQENQAQMQALKAELEGLRNTSMVDNSGVQISTRALDLAAVAWQAHPNMQPLLVQMRAYDSKQNTVGTDTSPSGLATKKGWPPLLSRVLALIQETDLQDFGPLTEFERMKQAMKNNTHAKRSAETQALIASIWLPIQDQLSRSARPWYGGGDSPSDPREQQFTNYRMRVNIFTLKSMVLHVAPHENAYAKVVVGLKILRNLEERVPGYALSVDYLAFNAAPSDIASYASWPQVGEGDSAEWKPAGGKPPPPPPSAQSSLNPAFSEAVAAEAAPRRKIREEEKRLRNIIRNMERGDEVHARPTRAKAATVLTSAQLPQAGQPQRKATQLRIPSAASAAVAHVTRADGEAPPSTKALTMTAERAAVLFNFAPGPAGKQSHGKTSKAAMAMMHLTADVAGGTEDNKRLALVQRELAVTRDLAAAERNAWSRLCGAATKAGAAVTGAAAKAGAAVADAAAKAGAAVADHKATLARIDERGKTRFAQTLAEQRERRLQTGGSEWTAPMLPPRPPRVGPGHNVVAQQGRNAGALVAPDELLEMPMGYGFPLTADADVFRRMVEAWEIASATLLADEAASWEDACGGFDNKYDATRETVRLQELRHETAITYIEVDTTYANGDDGEFHHGLSYEQLRSEVKLRRVSSIERDSVAPGVTRVPGDGAGKSITPAQRVMFDTAMEQERESVASCPDVRVAAHMELMSRVFRARCAVITEQYDIVSQEHARLSTTIHMAMSGTPAPARPALDDIAQAQFFNQHVNTIKQGATVLVTMTDEHEDGRYMLAEVDKTHGAAWRATHTRRRYDMVRTHAGPQLAQMSELIDNGKFGARIAMTFPHESVAELALVSPTELEQLRTQWRRALAIITAVDRRAPAVPLSGLPPRIPLGVPGPAGVGTGNTISVLSELVTSSAAATADAEAAMRQDAIMMGRVFRTERQVENVHFEHDGVRRLYRALNVGDRISYTLRGSNGGIVTSDAVVASVPIVGKARVKMIESGVTAVSPMPLPTMGFYIESLTLHEVRRNDNIDAFFSGIGRSSAERSFDRSGHRQSILRARYATGAHEARRDRGDAQEPHGSAAAGAGDRGGARSAQLGNRCGDHNSVPASQGGPQLDLVDVGDIRWLAAWCMAPAAALYAASSAPPAVRPCDGRDHVGRPEVHREGEEVGRGGVPVGGDGRRGGADIAWPEGNGDSVGAHPCACPDRVDRREPHSRCSSPAQGACLPGQRDGEYHVPRDDVEGDGPPRSARHLHASGTDVSRLHCVSGLAATSAAGETLCCDGRDQGVGVRDEARHGDEEAQRKRLTDHAKLAQGQCSTNVVEWSRRDHSSADAQSFADHNHSALPRVQLPQHEDGNRDARGGAAPRGLVGPCERRDRGFGVSGEARRTGAGRVGAQRRSRGARVRRRPVVSERGKGYGTALWTGRKSPPTGGAAADSAHLPIHAKATRSTMDLDALAAMADVAQPDIKAFYETSLMWTNPDTYSALINAPASERLKYFSVAHLTVDELEMLIEKQLVRRLPKEEVIALCTVFTVPEIFKNRRRVISWTRILNDYYSKDLLQELNLPQVPAVCARVLHAKWEAQSDVTCAFWQRGLGVTMQRMQAFPVADGGYACWTRLQMGCRNSVEVMSAVLAVCSDVGTDTEATPEQLTLARQATVENYVDNVAFTAETPEAVAAAMSIFRARCARACVALNETESPPVEAAEFLGVFRNFATSQVSAAAKIVRKIAESWERRGAWTRRDLAKHVGLCNFASRINGFPKATIFAALRYCAATLSMDGDDSRWDTLAEVPLDILQCFDRWTTYCIANKPRTPSDGDEEYQHLIITDAAAAGVGWVVICLTTGAVKMGQARWTTERFVHSTVGETWAPLMAMRHEFPHGTKDRIHIMSDNTATVAAYCRGYSKRELLNDAMAKVQAEYPSARLSATHVKGCVNPADRLSRFLASPQDESANPIFWRWVRGCLMAMESNVSVGISGAARKNSKVVEVPDVAAAPCSPASLENGYAVSCTA